MARWHHSPIHLSLLPGTYIVTAGTIGKEPLFTGKVKLDLLRETLFRLSLSYGWNIQAWSIFPNHYHFVATSRENPPRLAGLIRHLHSESSREINRLDSSPGRRVWFQYWETFIRSERSLFDRLRYVHFNAVHHGIVSCASNYPWCSAKCSEQGTEIQDFQRTIESEAEADASVPDDF
jgi:putative transposase